MTEKKFVHCIGDVQMMGNRAILRPLDHPGPDVSNTREVITSPVVSHDHLSGRLETANTIYVKEQ